MGEGAGVKGTVVFAKWERGEGPGVVNVLTPPCSHFPHIQVSGGVTLQVSSPQYLGKRCTRGCWLS